MDTEQALLAFAAKVDEFAATLTPTEQSMLADLITDEDDVSGFGFNTGWPGLTTVAPLKLTSMGLQCDLGEMGFQNGTRQ